MNNLHTIQLRLRVDDQIEVDRAAQIDSLALRSLIEVLKCQCLQTCVLEIGSKTKCTQTTVSDRHNRRRLNSDTVAGADHTVTVAGAGFAVTQLQAQFTQWHTQWQATVTQWHTQWQATVTQWHTQWHNYTHSKPRRHAWGHLYFFSVDAAIEQAPLHVTIYIGIFDH